MGALMAKKPYRARGGLYDTPTDGISRKVFDRYKDQQATKYLRVMERIRELENLLSRIEAALRSDGEE